jgi:hypothetical protein
LEFILDFGYLFTVYPLHSNLRSNNMFLLFILRKYKGKFNNRELIHKLQE